MRKLKIAMAGVGAIGAEPVRGDTTEPWETT